MRRVSEAQRLHPVGVQRLQVGRLVVLARTHRLRFSNDLAAVPVTYTHNIFSSFVYGISKGPFPFTISIRHEDESFIVLDDLLSLTRFFCGTSCLSSSSHATLL